MTNLDYLTLHDLKKHLQDTTHPILNKISLLNSVKYYTKFLNTNPMATEDQFIVILDQTNSEPVQCVNCKLQFSFMEGICIFCYLCGDRRLIFDLHIHDKKINSNGTFVFLLILIGDEHIIGPFIIKNYFEIINTYSPLQLRNLSIDREINIISIIKRPVNISS